MELVAYFLVSAVSWIWRLTAIVAMVLELWALIDSIMRKDTLFVAAGRRSKGFWVGVNALAFVITAMTGFASMFGLIAVVIACVYLTDVRPELQSLSPIKVRSRTRTMRDNRDDPRWRR